MADELLDIVDDVDRVVSHKMRSTVHRLGLWHRGVHVFLFTPQQALLVQVRSRHTDTYPLALDCSVSEHVKAGETYRHAALRGLKEELNLEHVHLQPVIKFRMQYGEGDFEICVLYTARAKISEVHFDPHEVEAVAFYRMEQLKEMVDGNPSAFSKWLAQLVFWVYGSPNELQILQAYKQSGTWPMP
jgi:isopentenyl-diphosphate delta-isomerase type 1